MLVYTWNVLNVYLSILFSRRKIKYIVYLSINEKKKLTKFFCFLRLIVLKSDQFEISFDLKSDQFEISLKNWIRLIHTRKLDFCFLFILKETWSYYQIYFWLWTKWNSIWFLFKEKNLSMIIFVLIWKWN